MKAVIQRVMQASVTVGERTVGSIGRGICVFIGISKHDTEKEMDYICEVPVSALHKPLVSELEDGQESSATQSPWTLVQDQKKSLYTNLTSIETIPFQVSDKLDASAEVRKILNIRIFSETEEKRWMKSVVDMDYEILCISQFTLDATLKGNKPDFSKAMGPELARSFYNTFLDTLRSRYKPGKIQDGEFGAYMQVHIQNDGPVTIPLEIKSNKDEGNSNKQHKSSDAGATNMTPGDS